MCACAECGGRNVVICVCIFFRSASHFKLMKAGVSPVLGGTAKKDAC